MMSMNRSTSTSVAFIVGLVVFAGSAKTKAEKFPTSGIVERLAPAYADNITFEQIESPSGKDLFELQMASDGKIVVRGNNSIAMAVGLNHYLKYHCKTSVSWFADQPVELPEKPPAIPHKIRREARVQKRFFLNYCTYGYTMPWWQWRDWERLIDWMALNGINMPLAITGQESVWYNVWKDFGLTDEEIRGYFTGPAQLPFHRMSIIDGLEGPLPHSYIDHQLELQKKILKRERELGMTPVLSAFNGHVPKSLSRVHPEAKLVRLGTDLKNPDSCYILDPVDPLFRKIQEAFIEEQTRLFGSNHIYGIDPFNEVKPPSWDPGYLATLSKAIFESLIEVDPEAEWLQMGWLFYFSRDHWTNERIEAYLTAVPQGKMTLLDYYCDNTEVWKFTEAFYGQPFIWCYLGNFGGNTILAGNMKEASERLEDALENSGGNLIGIGSTLEAMDGNPLVYEYVFEQAWESGTADLALWFEQWADRRYGVEDKNARAAWKLLMKTVYTSVPTLTQVTLTNVRPILSGRDSLPYSNADLFRAWELLLSADDLSRDACQYDMVNVGRQILGNHFLKLRNQFATDYKEKNIAALKATGSKMKEVLEDLDRLLSTRHSFLLGHWIEDARMFGKDLAEKAYYERNARLVVTTWTGVVHQVNDYANRNWAGLTKTFYAQRWEMLINEVIEAAEKGEPFDEEVFFDQVTEFEISWADGKEKYPHQPTGDSISIAKQLMKKYKGEIRELDISP